MSTEDPPLRDPDGTYNIERADGSLSPEKTVEWLEAMFSGGLKSVTFCAPDGRSFTVYPGPGPEQKP